MQRRLLGSSIALGAMLLAPATVSAQMPCTAVAAYLTAQPFISEVTVNNVTAGTPTTGQRCEADFTYSAKSGTADGYAVGQNQRIRIRVGMPRNAIDGGTGGLPGFGAWNGNQRNIGGGGGVGALSSVTAATNTRYVGTFTDSGHTTAEIGAFFSFGVIQPPAQPGNTLNYGKIRDFYADSLEQQFKWGKQLAQAYYGTPVARNYWDGCSTGGRQGLYLAREFGDQFDGFLVGAPAHYHMGRRLSDGAPGMVQVELSLKGKSISAGQRNATINASIAACDAMDGVVDGLLSDPRKCAYNAEDNMCGKPGAAAAPNCLDADQAAAINKIWDGPRNSFGKRIMVPWDRNITFAVGATPGSSASQVIKWTHTDLNYNAGLTYIDEGARNAAGNPPGSNTYAQEAQLGSTLVGDLIDGRSPDLSKAKNHGAKIIMWHGGQDNSSIRWALSLDYYTRVTNFFNNGFPDYNVVKPWFRFFMAPGVDHCGGGIGPQPLGLFEAVVNWAENGVAPDSILSSGGGRTRPLCPFPQTAIYDGVGDPNLASSFTCGGNMQTRDVICQGLITPYKHETENVVEGNARYVAGCFGGNPK